MMKAMLAFCALLGIATATPIDPPLQCSIGMSAEGRVKISVRNASSRVIEGDVYPFFILEPSSANSESNRNYASFWAPVDLNTGRCYGANQPKRLVLRPAQVIEVEVAPNKLFWARRISSQWPDHLLENSVPNGLYSLLLEIEGPGSNERAVSNRQAATVDKGVMRLLTEHP
jgi:hypothetical protein